MLSLCVGKRWLPTVEPFQMFFPRAVMLLGWSSKMQIWSPFNNCFQRKSLSSRVFLIEHIPRDLQESWLLLIWHLYLKKWGGKEEQSQNYWVKWFLLQHNSVSGGTGTGLQITKLPEEINHKKYSQSKTDISHDPAPQQKNRRCKSTSELLP